MSRGNSERVFISNCLECGSLTICFGRWHPHANLLLVEAQCTQDEDHEIVTKEFPDSVDGIPIRPNKTGIPYSVTECGVMPNNPGDTHNRQQWAALLAVLCGVCKTRSKQRKN